MVLPKLSVDKGSSRADSPSSSDVSTHLLVLPAIVFSFFNFLAPPTDLVALSSLSRLCNCLSLRPSTSLQPPTHAYTVLSSGRSLSRPASVSLPCYVNSLWMSWNFLSKKKKKVTCFGCPSFSLRRTWLALISAQHFSLDHATSCIRCTVQLKKLCHWNSVVFSFF